MKKLAVFVEGQTEQLFVAAILRQIAGDKNIAIEVQKAGRSKTGRRIFRVTTAASPITHERYFVLIRDCGGDQSVKSDIIDACPSLAKQNYNQILGLRDVYPLTHSDIPALKKYLTYGVPTKYFPIAIMLAIMEIEAWFLAELDHYQRIHKDLTLANVIAGVGFDPGSDDVELRPHPAEDLKNIYQLVGRNYTKAHSNTLRTVRALDYESLYFSLRTKVPSLGLFIDQIDTFLS